MVVLIDEGTFGPATEKLGREKRTIPLLERLCDFTLLDNVF